MTLQKHLDENNLWEEGLLAKYCEANQVYVKTSQKYPSLILLHYADEVSYGKTWNTFNRMCRGAILDLKRKRVVAWPFDKFFNLNEHESSNFKNLFGKPFLATEKLDGSMLILFRDPDSCKNRFTTKGSFDSEHAEYANSIMPKKLEFLDISQITFMFELIDSKFRNVIDYKKKGYKDGIYLIGARLIESGDLVTNMQLQDLAEHIGIPVYKTFDFNAINQVIDNCENLPATEEGYVLKFDNEQHLVKVKGKDYVIAHRIMKGMNDNALIDALKEDKKREILTNCPEEYREEVEIRFKKVEDLACKFIKQAFENFHQCKKNFKERKAFALEVNKTVSPALRKFMFVLYDGQDKRVPNMALELVQKLFIKEGNLTE